LISVKDRSLAVPIRDVRMVLFADHIEHHGTRTEVERDILADARTGITRDRQVQTIGLDLAVPDDGAALAPDHDRVRPQAAVLDNRCEVVDMDDVVDLGAHRYRHRQAAKAKRDVL